MSKNNNEFFQTLEKDIHIFKTMNDLEIYNYLHTLLKRIFKGDFAFKTSLIKITALKSYSIESAIKNNKLRIFNYNNDPTYEIFDLKDFSFLVTDFYKRKLRSGKLWVALY